MWVMAVFDLPVGTKAERKRATGFRKHLLDLGFSMMQFSVYIHHCAGKDAAAALADKIGAKVPKAGCVDVLFFTDKQYEQIRVYRGTRDRAAPKAPSQLELF
jgi:CRISPR-associated protein Cas2